MKKCLSLLLAVVMCFSMITMTVGAFHVEHSVEGTREINDIHLDDNHQILMVTDNYIGDVDNKLTLVRGADRVEWGSEWVPAVYFLPDEETPLEINMTIKKLPDSGRQYCLVDGEVYFEDGHYVGYSPIFTWGENKQNADGSWVAEPIGPGKDGLSLSLGIYEGTILSDDDGNFLDDYRVNVGDELVFTNPNDPKGIPYMRYYELSDGNRFSNFLMPVLTLTPAIADEILTTGGHYENGMFYPILEYFPNVEQLILDAYAAGYGAPQVPTISAIPTPSAVLVDGENVVFDSYNINDYNYFKLRDLAYILNGTEKQFEVAWDDVNNTIALTSGSPYTTVGGEMIGKGTGVKEAVETTSKVMIDGAEASFTAYNIEGNNYFKLRDIGEAFGFGVEWDEANNTIVISTAEGASEEASAEPVTHPATIAEREKKAKEAAQQIVDGYGMQGMSDYSKAFLIYQHLYDNVEVQTDQSDEAYKTNFGNEAYAAFVLKKAACSGYCKAVMMLCEAAGLECKHINAGQWTHQWNMVLVDGEWIVLDAQGGVFGTATHPME